MNRRELFGGIVVALILPWIPLLRSWKRTLRIDDGKHHVIHGGNYDRIEVLRGTLESRGDVVTRDLVTAQVSAGASLHVKGKLTVLRHWEIIGRPQSFVTSNAENRISSAYGVDDFSVYGIK